MRNTQVRTPRSLPEPRPRLVHPHERFLDITSWAPRSRRATCSAPGSPWHRRSAPRPAPAPPCPSCAARRSTRARRRRPGDAPFLWERRTSARQGSPAAQYRAPWARVETHGDANRLTRHACSAHMAAQYRASNELGIRRVHRSLPRSSPLPHSTPQPSDTCTFPCGTPRACVPFPAVEVLRRARARPEVERDRAHGVGRRCATLPVTSPRRRLRAPARRCGRGRGPARARRTRGRDADDALGSHAQRAAARSRAGVPAARDPTGGSPERRARRRVHGRARRRDRRAHDEPDREASTAALRWLSTGRRGTAYDWLGGRGSMPLHVAGLGLVAAGETRLDDAFLPQRPSRGRQEVLGRSFGWRNDNHVLGWAKLAPIESPQAFSVEVMGSRVVSMPYDPMITLERQRGRVLHQRAVRAVPAVPRQPHHLLSRRRPPAHDRRPAGDRGGAGDAVAAREPMARRAVLAARDRAHVARPRDAKPSS